jgi:hypothetical protein
MVQGIRVETGVASTAAVPSTTVDVFVAWIVGITRVILNKSSGEISDVDGSGVGRV